MLYELKKLNTTYTVVPENIWSYLFSWKLILYDRVLTNYTWDRA